MWESWIHKAVLIMLLVQIWEVMIQKQSGELFSGAWNVCWWWKAPRNPSSCPDCWCGFEKVSAWILNLATVFLWGKTRHEIRRKKWQRIQSIVTFSPSVFVIDEKGSARKARIQLARTREVCDKLQLSIICTCVMMAKCVSKRLFCKKPFWGAQLLWVIF